MGATEFAPMPEAVREKADALQLGACLDGTRERVQRVRGVVGFAVLATAFFGAFGALFTKGLLGVSLIAGVVCAMLFAAADVAVVVFAWRIRGDSDWLFEKGRVNFRRGSVDSLAWYELSDVRHSTRIATKRRDGYLERYELHVYELVQGNRVVRIMQGRETDGSVQAARAIAEGVARSHALIDTTRQRIVAGERVELGPVTLDRAGLAFDGTYHPWPELEFRSASDLRVRFATPRGQDVDIDFRTVPDGGEMLHLAIRLAAEAAGR